MGMGGQRRQCQTRLLSMNIFTTFSSQHRRYLLNLLATFDLSDHRFVQYDSFGFGIIPDTDTRYTPNEG